MSKSEEAEALRAAILAYMHKCNKEVLADVLATILEGKTLADLPEHLRSRFEEVSVAPGTVVLALKPKEQRNDAVTVPRAPLRQRD